MEGMHYPMKGERQGKLGWDGKKYKIALFGEGGTGKSTFTLYYLQFQGPNHDVLSVHLSPTIYEDIDCRQDVIDGEECVLLIQDTPGMEEYGDSCWPHQIKSSEGFMLVYAVTNESSFYALVNK